MSGTETATSGASASSSYVHPEVLVETGWVADHLNDASVRLIEADEDVLLYEIGHLPGAVKLDWHVDVQDPVSRDFVDRQGFENLMSHWGISNETTIVLYGDKNNWYACYSFWLFSMYGHKNMKIMNGGRQKWETEGRQFTKEVPHFEPTTYHAQPMDESIRAFRDDVLIGLKDPNRRLIDVRSPQEYTGELLHMVNYPQEGLSVVDTFLPPRVFPGQQRQILMVLSDLPRNYVRSMRERTSLAIRMLSVIAG
jgi:thiosulfate/3-mercaptopyruvate sulfurtransferase